MRRLGLFLGALSWSSRLHMLVVAIFLGNCAWFDYRRGWSGMTVAIILMAWLLGWLMKPLMMANPRVTFRIWSTFGIAVLLTYFFCQNQVWWRLIIAHYAREFVMWLDVSCGYWFLSELRLQQLRQLDSLLSTEGDQDLTGNSDSHDLRDDEFRDERPYRLRG